MSALCVHIWTDDHVIEGPCHVGSVPQSSPNCWLKKVYKVYKWIEMDRESFACYICTICIYVTSITSVFIYSTFYLLYIIYNYSLFTNLIT